MANPTFELTEELVNEIEALIQRDIDATFACRQAIDGVDDADLDVKSQLQAFMIDHERHIQELGGFLRAYGQEPPEYGRDFKGFLIEGMTAIRSAMGTRQALEAMRQNEELTNDRYEEALRFSGVPAELIEVLFRGREDERRHLESIEQWIARFDAADEGDAVRV